MLNKDKIINKKSILSKCVLVAGLVLCLSGCANKNNNESLNKGMEFVEAGDYNSAIECFEQAILNNEDSELIFRGQGLAYMGLGDYSQAEEAFLRSIANADKGISPLEFDTNYYLAASYMKQAKYSDAENIYTAIITLKNKELQAYYLRACARLKQGNFDASFADFEKAFSLDADNLKLVIDAYNEMVAAGYTDEGKKFVQEFMDKKGKSIKDKDKGILYYYIDDYANARLCLDPFMNGNDAEVSLILGQTYEKLGDMNYASVVYQTYLDGNEPNAAIYNGLGSCLLKQGKYQEALDTFNKGIELGDTGYLKDLSFNQIVATEYIGKFDKAKIMMEDYLKKYPDDSKAAREYLFLQTR